MFPSRRLLSLGLRMTLQHLQDNVTSMRNLQKPALYAQRSNFSLATIFRSELSQQPPVEDVVPEESFKQKLAQIVGKMQLSFTCKKCNTRSHNKIISKHAYTKGVVVVRCDGCKNNHLIADNLGWFGDSDTRNIEVILKRQGQTVRRIRDDHEGYFEAVSQEEVLRIETLLKQHEASQGIKPVEEVEEEVKVTYEKVGQPQNN